MDLSLQQIYGSLGIGDKLLVSNRLPLQQQPPLAVLEVVEIDFEGKPFILIHSAASAWVEMKTAALAEGVELLPFSGFRSYLHQKNLIERHLKKGRKIEDILTHIAIPGYSEHHTGRAIDIYAAGNPVLDEAFEATEAFRWLTKNAARFGFQLSYPRGNDLGIVYEPWHWFYTETFCL